VLLEIDIMLGAIDFLESLVASNLAVLAILVVLVAVLVDLGIGGEARETTSLASLLLHVADHALVVIKLRRQDLVTAVRALDFGRTCFLVLVPLPAKDKSLLAICIGTGAHELAVLDMGLESLHIATKLDLLVTQRAFDRETPHHRVGKFAVIPVGNMASHRASQVTNAAQTLKTSFANKVAI